MDASSSSVSQPPKRKRNTRQAAAGETPSRKTRTNKGWSRQKKRTTEPAEEAFSVQDILHEHTLDGARYFLIVWAGKDPDTDQPWEHNYEPESSLGEDLLSGWRLKEAAIRAAEDPNAARKTIHWYLRNSGTTTLEYKRQRREQILESSVLARDSPAFVNRKRRPSALHIQNSNFERFSNLSSPVAPAPLRPQTEPLTFTSSENPPSSPPQEVGSRPLIEETNFENSENFTSSTAAVVPDSQPEASQVAKEDHISLEADQPSSFEQSSPSPSTLLAISEPGRREESSGPFVHDFDPTSIYQSPVRNQDVRLVINPLPPSFNREEYTRFTASQLDVHPSVENGVVQASLQIIPDSQILGVSQIAGVSQATEQSLEEPNSSHSQNSLISPPDTPPPEEKSTEEGSEPRTVRTGFLLAPTPSRPPSISSGPLSVPGHTPSTTSSQQQRLYVFSTAAREQSFSLGPSIPPPPGHAPSTTSSQQIRFYLVSSPVRTPPDSTASSRDRLPPLLRNNPRYYPQGGAYATQRILAPAWEWWQSILRNYRSPECEPQPTSQPATITEEGENEDEPVIKREEDEESLSVNVNEEEEEEEGRNQDREGTNVSPEPSQFVSQIPFEPSNHSASAHNSNSNFGTSNREIPDTFSTLPRAPSQLSGLFQNIEQSHRGASVAEENQHSIQMEPNDSHRPAEVMNMDPAVISTEYEAAQIGTQDANQSFTAQSEQHSLPQHLQAAMAPSPNAGRKRSLSDSSDQSITSQTKRARRVDEQETLSSSIPVTMPPPAPTEEREALMAIEDFLRNQLQMERQMRENLEVQLGALQSRFEEQSETNRISQLQLTNAQVEIETIKARVVRLLADIQELKSDRTTLREERDVLRQAARDSADPNFQQLAKALEGAEKAKTLEKRLELLQGDLAYAQEKYQSASAAAQESNEEASALRAENEELKRKASGEAARLRALFQDDTNQRLRDELEMVKAERSQLRRSLALAGAEEKKLLERLEREERRAGMSLNTRSSSPRAASPAASGATRGGLLNPSPLQNAQNAEDA